MDAYKKTFIDEMTRQQTELQRASGDYQQKRATMSDATRTAKEAELTDMQKRFQDYQNTANQSVEAKGAEYMKPLLEQLHTAIEAVAKEKGFTYVFDTAQTALLVSPPADDLAPSVKLKLGLK
jgi:outer membrane protein